MAISDALTRILGSGLDMINDTVSTAKKLSKTVVDDVGDVMAKNGINSANLEDTLDFKYQNYRSEKNKWKARKKKEHSDTFGASSAIEAEDLLERGIVSAGKLGYKSTKGLGKFAFKTPVKNDDAFFGYDIGMNKKASIPLGIALGTVPIALALGSEYEKSKIGDIEGGLIANTVNATFSPGVQRVTDSAQAGGKGADNFRKNVLQNTVSARLAKVDPDIVFALHTLRNDKNVLGNEVVH